MVEDNNIRSATGSTYHQLSYMAEQLYTNERTLDIQIVFQMKYMPFSMQTVRIASHATDAKHRTGDLKYFG